MKPEAYIRRMIDELENDCLGYWACKGSNHKPEAMATCRLCRTIYLAKQYLKTREPHQRKED